MSQVFLFIRLIPERRALIQCNNRIISNKQRKSVERAIDFFSFSIIFYESRRSPENCSNRQLHIAGSESHVPEILFYTEDSDVADSRKDAGGLLPENSYAKRQHHPETLPPSVLNGGRS